MQTRTTAKKLSFSEASRAIEASGCFVDLRDTPSYLDVHVPGSISLPYERGPGFQSRARDCIPLEVPLILLEREGVDAVHCAASLRGKGFAVLGVVSDGVNEWASWHGTPASTETYRGPRPRSGAVLHVGDPGAAIVDDAVHIPIEKLWGRAGEIANEPRVTVVAGKGLRAGMAVGILERAGVDQIVFWETLENRGSKRPS